ncbi:MAG: hypothetical protein ACXW32_13355 [Limisphaerales bacterium]
MLVRRTIFGYLLALLLFPAWIAAADQAKKSSPGVKPLPDPPGVHNLFSLGTNLYSGSTPEGDEGFAALKRLGVKTVVSVDGAKPDVELAKKHGMRYVHLPHGYDGISTHLQSQLAKVGAELPGPIYVHCHHGKHRGPAAAAVICMTKDSWDAAQAEQWLKAAGTSTNYTGLYAVVRDFKRPTAAQLKALPSDFPEIAQVSGLIDAMVGVDERWENLKAVRAAGYGAPRNHPDIEPANEAVILWEHYREAQRLRDTIQKGDDFVQRFKTAETEVKDAARLLRLFATDSKPEIRAQLDKSFDAIGKSCSSCHKTYRDAARIKSSLFTPLSGPISITSN